VGYCPLSFFIEKSPIASGVYLQEVAVVQKTNACETGFPMAISNELLEELRTRIQEVDLPTLLVLEREVQLRLERLREDQPQSELSATAKAEFRQQYPHLAVDPDLFALVGIHPASPVEQDKTLIREQIFRKLAE
jgi:hypothetical protein